MATGSSPRRVLVTGGAGFIGSHLVDALIARGDEVVVLDDLSTGKRGNLSPIDRVRFIEGSVADPAAVAEAVAGCQLVFHEAAIASVPRTVEAPLETNAVNLGGTLNVLKAAHEAGVKRLVFASSAATYGERDDAAVETDAPNPQSPYAVEKLSSEHYLAVYAKLFGLETVALRYFNVFGPRQDPKSPYSGVVSIFVDRLLAGRRPTIYGDGGQTRDFVYVGDVVRANLLAADAVGASGQVFNVARGESTSLNALYTELARLTGGPTEPEYAPTRAGDIRHSLACIDRAREALAFEPKTSVADGLAALLGWAKASR